MKKQKQITLMIDRKKFCDWFFDTSQTEITGQSLVNELIAGGKCEMTLQECLDSIGYIPIHIVINKKDIRKEDIDKYGQEISEPSSLYIIKLEKKKEK